MVSDRCLLALWERSGTTVTKRIVGQALREEDSHEVFLRSASTGGRMRIVRLALVGMALALMLYGSFVMLRSATGF